MDHVCTFGTFRTMRRKGETTISIIGECASGHTVLVDTIRTDVAEQDQFAAGTLVGA